LRLGTGYGWSHPLHLSICKRGMVPHMPSPRPPTSTHGSVGPRLEGNQRKGMDSLFTLTSWQIWKERNTRCFKEAATTVPDLLLIIKVEANQWAQAGAKNLRSLASGVACYPPRSSMYSIVSEPGLGLVPCKWLLFLLNAMICNALT
jgi:hypothetical protein